jgi:hypothetical protein
MFFFILMLIYGYLKSSSLRNYSKYDGDGELVMVGYVEARKERSTGDKGMHG